MLTYSNNAEVPQEEVKAQHSRMQKMHAPPRFVDSFHMNIMQDSPLVLQPPFLIPCWHSKCKTNSVQFLPLVDNAIIKKNSKKPIEDNAQEVTIKGKA